MKSHFKILLLCVLATATAFAQQPKNVQMSQAAATRSQILEDLKFGTGRTGTFLAGSTLIASGVVTFNPTAGSTFNFANVTVSNLSGIEGAGTVTSASVVTANGVSATVANASSTPAFTFTLGAITPTSVNSVVLSGSSTPTLAVTGTTAVSGTNTGDQNAFANIIVSGQTTVTANATAGNVTLVAGGNVTITTDNATKSITISSSGGAGSVTNSTVLDNNVFMLGAGGSAAKNSTVSWDPTGNGTMTVGTNGTGAIVAQAINVTTVNADSLALGNAITGNVGGTGVDNGSRTLTYAGNVAISGAYNFNLTLTANTALTAPTSGTLATLAGTESLTNKTYNGVTLTGGTNSVTLTNGTTTANISGGYAGNIILGGAASTTLPEIDAKVGFRGIPWVVANANVTTNATHNGKGIISDALSNNTTVITLNRTQAATDAANGGFSMSVFQATSGNIITVTASSGNIILAGSGNLTGGTSAVIAAGGLATFSLANATLIVAGSNVTVP